MSLLEVKGLNTYYGDSHILFDVALTVERNEVVALLGRNGAGKSTTLKSLMGVRHAARRLDHVRRRRNRREKEPRHRAGRHAARATKIAASSAASNVEENLILAGLTAPNRWPLERIYAMFPRLKERRRQPRHRSVRRRAADAGDRARAGAASRRFCCSTSRSRGWRRSSCAICWPRAAKLAEAGQTILIVEQNISAAMTLAHRVYIINNGHIVDSADRRSGARTARNIAPASRRVTDPARRPVTCKLTRRADPTDARARPLSRDRREALCHDAH